jgi:hypothetical protein
VTGTSRRNSSLNFQRPPDFYPQVPVTYPSVSLMKLIFKLATLFGLLALLLAGCGGESPPTLPEAGQPTLVFIYTDG